MQAWSRTSASTSRCREPTATTGAAGARTGAAVAATGAAAAAAVGASTVAATWPSTGTVALTPAWRVGVPPTVTIGPDPSPTVIPTDAVEVSLVAAPAPVTGPTIATPTTATEAKASARVGNVQTCEISFSFGRVRSRPWDVAVATRRRECGEGASPVA